jgi:hypothetical protein
MSSLLLLIQRFHVGIEVNEKIYKPVLFCSTSNQKKGGRNEIFIKKRPKVIKGVFHRGESYCGKCLEVCHTGEPCYSREAEVQ